MTTDVGIPEAVFFLSFFFFFFFFFFFHLLVCFPLALLEMKIWLSVGLN